MLDTDEVDRLRIALARISKQIDRQVGGGMPRSQLSLLGRLVRRGAAGMGELAAAEGLHTTMLSRMVAHLEARDLVERYADPDDGRAVRVRATTSGKRLQAKFRRERSDLIAASLAGLPEEVGHQLQAAIPALELLAADLTAHHQPLLVAR